VDAYPSAITIFLDAMEANLWSKIRFGNLLDSMSQTLQKLFPTCMFLSAIGVLKKQVFRKMLGTAGVNSLLDFGTIAERFPDHWSRSVVNQTAKTQRIEELPPVINWKVPNVDEKGDGSTLTTCLLPLCSGSSPRLPCYLFWISRSENTFSRFWFLIFIKYAYCTQKARMV
jgi:hypothetical protein